MVVSVVMIWVTRIAKQAGCRAALVVGVLVDHFPEPSAPPVIFLSQHEPSPSQALLHLARLARYSACLNLEQPYSFTRSRLSAKSGILGNVLDDETKNVLVYAELNG